MNKFTRQWKGRVKVEKKTTGAGREFYVCAIWDKTADCWWYLQSRDTQSGKMVITEHTGAPAAMTEAQRVWNMNFAASIVKTERVF